MDDAATPLQAICCRLGLAIPGFACERDVCRTALKWDPGWDHAHLAAVLADRTVRENIMTGLYFPGCKSCGTYDRHNQVAQVALAYFRYYVLRAEIHKLIAQPA
jgi:hypothetical protein